MTTPETFDSSDSVRDGGPLPHAKSVTFPGPVSLECGGQLPEITLAYETYGRLNARRDNAVLICHALSGDSHVARHDPADSPGWWDLAVGPGRAIDTDRYFVICPNVLGGCRGSTGPNTINPQTGSPYGPRFPIITVGDIVESQRRLVDHLEIPRLRAVVGGSLGGHMALTWAVRYPQRMAGTVACATSSRLTSQALAFDIVGRNAILHDPGYEAGHYYDRSGPKTGLAIARMLGHITYLSRESMMAKFDADRMSPRDVATAFETKFSVGSYLAYQGDRFGERFDANSYITLSMAMDLFDLGASRSRRIESFAPARCKWLVISFTSDWLFPPFQSQEIVDTLLALDQPVSYCNVESSCGHDAFLLDNELASYGGLIGGFLDNLDPAYTANHTAQVDPGADHKPTSIFHNRERVDYELIAELIPENSSVLDLGCGTGGLLSLLRSRGHRRMLGVELDERSVVACVRRGLNVIQADLNKGLSSLGDGQFDVVVLSQTLQTVIDVRRVIHEMLRVGQQALVSFPNLGYHKLRQQLYREGRAPLVALGGGTCWYDTHNVRFLTIEDFNEFCRDEGIRIHETVALDTEAGTRVREDPNRNADMAILVISR